MSRRRSLWLDSDCTRVDFAKCLVAKAYRTKLRDPVHRHDPEPVHVYLSLASFPLSRASSSSSSTLEGTISRMSRDLCSKLCMSLDCFYFLGNDTVPPQAKKRCMMRDQISAALQDSWMRSSTTAGRVRNVQTYRSLRRRARAWLRRNAHLTVVADTNKGLGDGLFSRE